MHFVTMQYKTVLLKLCLTYSNKRQQIIITPKEGEALVAAAKLKMDDQLLTILPKFLIEKGEQGEEDMFNAVRALSFVESSEALPYLNQIIDRSTSLETQRTAYNLTFQSLIQSKVTKFLESKLESSDELQKKNRYLGAEPPKHH